MRQVPVNRDMHEQLRRTAWKLLSLLTLGQHAKRADSLHASAARDTKTGAKNWKYGIRAGVPQALCAMIATVCLISDDASAQTTRTNSSAASSSATMPSSSSTSPNAPCNSFNPTSPCYSGRIPRNPCYSAAAPDQPCSTTTTPNPQAPPPPPLPAASKSPPPDVAPALTQDQAKAQIEAKGYSRVSDLRRGVEGVWYAKAEKDGLMQSVTLDRKGNVNAY